MHQEFQIGGKTYSFWDVSGTIKSITILSGTNVFERGGRVGSATTHKREVWLTREDNGQDQLIVFTHDFPVTEGQDLTAVFLREGNRDRLVQLYNNSNGASSLLMRGAVFMATCRRDFGCCLGLLVPPLLCWTLYMLRDIVGPGDVPMFQPKTPDSLLDPWWYVVPAGLMVAMVSINAVRRRRHRLKYQEELAKFLTAINAGFHAKRQADAAIKAGTAE